MLTGIGELLRPGNSFVFLFFSFFFGVLTSSPRDGDLVYIYGMRRHPRGTVAGQGLGAEHGTLVAEHPQALARYSSLHSNNLLTHTLF